VTRSARVPVPSRVRLSRVLGRDLCDGLQTRIPRGLGAHRFLQFDVEIRKIIRTINAIESINSRLRRALNARGDFPDRVGRVEVSLPRVDGFGPHRRGPRTLDHALEKPHSTPSRSPSTDAYPPAATDLIKIQLHRNLTAPLRRVRLQ
jgi:hypothetical protein